MKKKKKKKKKIRIYLNKYVVFTTDTSTRRNLRRV